MTKNIITLSLLAGLSAPATQALEFEGGFAIQQESISIKGSKTRNRQKLKANLLSHHDLNNFSKLNIGIASGSTSPTSTFETLGSSFSSKAVALDIANVEVTTWKKQLVSSFGKMKDPFTRVGKNQLQWDSDVRPEGSAVSFKNTELEATVAAFYLEERSANEDSLLIGADLFFPVTLNSKSSLRIGAGFFGYTQLKGKSPLVDTTNSYGNSVNTATAATGATTLTYAENYNILSPAIELNTQLMGLPFTPYFEFAYNTAASDDNSGWTLGAKVGKVKKWLDFAVHAYFLRKEADAVLGSITDGNFYSQSTGSQGFVLSGALGLFENAKASLTWYRTDAIKDPKALENRLQLALSAKF